MESETLFVSLKVPLLSSIGLPKHPSPLEEQVATLDGTAKPGTGMPACRLDLPITSARTRDCVCECDRLRTFFCELLTEPDDCGTGGTSNCNSINRAISAIFRCLTSFRPFSNRCLAAIDRIWSSKTHRKVIEPDLLALPLPSRVWAEWIWIKSDLESSLSALTSICCNWTAYLATPQPNRWASGSMIINCQVLITIKRRCLDWSSCMVTWQAIRSQLVKSRQSPSLAKDWPLQMGNWVSVSLRKCKEIFRIRK